MRTIKGFEDYCITEDGRVYSKKRGKFLKHGVAKNGYCFFILSKTGKTYYRYAHRLVAQNYLGDRKKLQVNHIDGNKSNNTLANLEWVTAVENITHAVVTGLFKRSC